MGRLPVTKAKTIKELLESNIRALEDQARHYGREYAENGGSENRDDAIRCHFGADLLEELQAVQFAAAKPAEQSCAAVSVDQRPYSPRIDVDGPLESLPVTEAGSLKELLAANIAAFDDHVEKQTQRFVDSPLSWRRADIVRIRFAAEILRKLLPLA